MDAIKTPEPLLSTTNLPPLFKTNPETLTSPFAFTRVVSPEAFEVLPEISIPLEPVLIISILPLPKFFILPAIAVPPFAP